MALSTGDAGAAGLLVQHRQSHAQRRRQLQLVGCGLMLIRTTSLL